MKCTKVLRRVTLSVLLLFLCLSFCPKEAMAAGIKLNKTAITLCRYHEYKLKVTGTKQKVKWKSSNKIVASVNQKGVVKANEAGTAIIKATIDKKQLTCKVTVKEYTPQEEYAAYGYLAAQKLFLNDKKLKISDARYSTYMDGREFSYFQCTYTDNAGKSKTAYVSIYQNDSSSLLEMNVNTKRYGNLIVEISGSKMEQMLLDRSTELNASSIEKIATLIEKNEVIAPTTGDMFQTKHAWLNL